MGVYYSYVHGRLHRGVFRIFNGGFPDLCQIWVWGYAPPEFFLGFWTLKDQFCHHLGPVNSTHNVVVATLFYCNNFIIIIMIINNNNIIRVKVSVNN